ncbi:response regulator transcription factor [Roseiconus nitratireducens]|uniref:Response regulator transcription factor n=1 Tax=Roseiconus nitratireducens TaxID=2605748 RepID=A0A5M6D7P6_9BACT|nr:response regulator transcription factor [Roseiconus nitratireducens]KAA5542676.1 response regulator transcription factor [Roseiconus nitratireducens]
MTARKSNPAKILIVDDHPMMRDGLATRISDETDLSVCGEAEDVAEAMQKVRDLRPDLVIVDISLKTGHGIDLIKRIRTQHPKTKMLVNSTYDETVYAERSLHAGAMGYLCKQTARETLIDAIRTVLAGKTYVSPEMTERILKSRVGGIVESGKNPIDSLSNRELEVLTLIGQGQTTGAIATLLHLSVHTIDTYREKLKIKLNLANSAELNRYAAQWVLEHG